MLVLGVRTCGEWISLLAVEEVPNTSLLSPDTVSQRFRGGSCHRIVGGSDNGWQHEATSAGMRLSSVGAAYLATGQRMHTGLDSWLFWLVTQPAEALPTCTVAIEGQRTEFGDNSSSRTAEWADDKEK